MCTVRILVNDRTQVFVNGELPAKDDAACLLRLRRFRDAYALVVGSLDRTAGFTLFGRAFDRDKADIVIEVRPRRKREHFLQDSGEKLIGREACIAVERRDKGFLAELFPLGRVYLKDSVCEKDDAIAIVEGSARSRK